MSRADRNQPLNHSVARTLAALLGTIPVALAFGLALAFVLPVPIGKRYLIGSLVVFPAWMSASCWAFLAPDAKRAWLALSALFAIAAIAAAAGRALGGHS